MEFIPSWTVHQNSFIYLEETTLTTIQSTTALSNNLFHEKSHCKNENDFPFLGTMLITTELSSYSSNQSKNLRFEITLSYTCFFIHIKARPTYFSPASCPNSTHIGIYCNVSNAPCDTLKPCQNNGSCINRNKASYHCICPLGFNGVECQVDNRPCKPHTCRNQGIYRFQYSFLDLSDRNLSFHVLGNCTEVNNDTFRCTCAFGWTGIRCETMVNHCDNVTCQNRGVCLPLLGKYKCECLGDSFSGEHCEKTATHMVVRQVVSKSFAYVAILALFCVVAFIVIMDILKYGFGIDPVREELERIRRQKRAKRAKPPVIVRHTYINAPPESQQQISAEETITV